MIYQTAKDIPNAVFFLQQFGRLETSTGLDAGGSLMYCAGGGLVAGGVLGLAAAGSYFMSPSSKEAAAESDPLCDTGN